LSVQVEYALDAKSIHPQVVNVVILEAFQLTPRGTSGFLKGSCFLVQSFSFQV
jgi:hypothetical protein